MGEKKDTHFLMLMRRDPKNRPKRNQVAACDEAEVLFYFCFRVRGRQPKSQRGAVSMAGVPFFLVTSQLIINDFKVEKRHSVAFNIFFSFIPFLSLCTHHGILNALQFIFKLSKVFMSSSLSSKSNTFMRNR